MRWLSRFLLLIVLLAAWLSAGQGPALAHATLVSSAPPADSILRDGPSSVQIWFSEAVEGRSSRIAVYDSTGQRVDKRNLVPVAGDPRSIKVDLEPVGSGRYSVAWQVMSAVDGHITAGSFAFTVGEAAPVQTPSSPEEGSVASPGPSLVEVLLRWISLTVGAVLFSGFALALLYRRTREQEAGSPLEASFRLFRRDLRATMAPALIMMAFVTSASLFLQAVNTGDTSPPALMGFLTETRFGLVWLLRAGLLACLATLIYSRNGGRWDWKPWTGLALGALLLLTFSLNSHAASVVGQGPLPILSDWLHLLAASAWLGGLIHLALGYIRRPGLLLLPFSSLAIFSVSVLLLTGLYNAWLEVGALDSLLVSPYGRVLLVKLGLSIPALALGGINLLRSKHQGGGGRGGADNLGSKTLVWESVLVTSVFLAVALMTALLPGRQAAVLAPPVKQIVMTEKAGEVTFTLEIAPGSVGRNDFRVSLQGVQGQPIEEDGRIIMRFSYLDGNLDTEGAYSQRIGPGLFGGSWSYLQAVGRWNIDVVFRRNGQDDLSASFLTSVEITDAAVSAGEVPASTSGPVSRLVEIEIMLLGFIVIGAVWAHRTSLGQALGEPFGRFLKSLGYDLGRPAQKEAVRALFSMGGLMAFLGAYLLFGDFLDPASSAGLPKNPIRPSSESRAIGKEIYGQVCLSCHGPEGEGQKTGVQQGLPGLDLRPHMLAHPSGQIYVWVTYGLGAEMPAFEEQLSAEERWHLVNYIRTLGEPSLPAFHAH